MARIYTNGFESSFITLVTRNNDTFVGASVTTVNARKNQNGHGGNRCLFLDDTSDSYVCNLPNANEIFIRFAYRGGNTTNSTANTGKFLSLRNGSTSIYSLRHNTTNTISLFTGDTTNLVSTTVNTYTINTWHLIEIRYAPQLNQLIQIKINEQPVLVHQPSSASNTNVSNIRFFGSTTQGCYIDDIAVNDTTNTVNNSWIGNGYINRLSFNADTLVEFSRSQGVTNHENVNVDPYLTGTRVFSVIPNVRDLYSSSGLPLSANLVNAVKIISVANRVATEAPGTLQHILKSPDDEPNDIGLPVPLNVGSVIYPTATLDLNPYTSLPFTPGEINNMSFGISLNE